MSTALAAGDFDYFDRNHHGTPEVRREAWLPGYSRGESLRCQDDYPA